VAVVVFDVAASCLLSHQRRAQTSRRSTSIIIIIIIIVIMITTWCVLIPTACWIHFPGHLPGVARRWISVGPPTDAASRANLVSKKQIMSHRAWSEKKPILCRLIISSFPLNLFTVSQETHLVNYIDQLPFQRKFTFEGRPYTHIDVSQF